MAGTATAVTISALQINTTIGDYLFIAVNGTDSGPASCSTNTQYQFVLNLTTNEGQQTMALLLAARASGATVTIIGTGACTSGFSTVETLGSIQY